MESIVMLVKKARSYEKNSMQSLLIKFDPTINNLLRKLGYDCVKTDLIIFFIKMIYSIQLASIFNLSDGALVNYIKESLFREYYRLNEIYIFNEVKMPNKFSELSDNFKFIKYKTLIYELVNLKIISNRQKCVLLEKYHYSPTNKEISQVRSVK